MGKKPVFLIHKENKDFLQGKRDKPILNDGQGGGWILPLFVVVFSLVAVGLAVRTGFDWRDYITLRDRGIVAQGQYTDKYISSDTEGDTHYLRYAFNVDGNTYHGRIRITPRVYRSASVGAPVEVLYVPSNPRISDVAFLNNPPVLSTGFTMFWWLITSGIVIGVGIYHTKTSKLLKHGRVLRGEVERAEEHFDNDNDRWIHIDYLYQKPGTKDIVTSKYKFMNYKRKPPPRGTPVAVFYADEHTKRLL